MSKRKWDSETAPEPVLAAVASRLRTEIPDLLAVYAFDSRVQGDAGAGSDLDLAVLVPGYADAVMLWRLSGDLAELAGCPVDLLDLRAASSVMQDQVLTHGRRLWASGSQADFFEVAALNEKLMLDQRRAGLLADIAQRETVYGR